jgi:hypothetical protein
VILDKDRMMDNVQKHNICTNVPSSQTFRSYLQVRSFTAVDNLLCILITTIRFSQVLKYEYLKMRSTSSQETEKESQWNREELADFSLAHIKQ